ncbi:hypothetical protein [Anaerotignum sp.]|uniref:hypothetical protein n=1 Tax=Anaerotignum sp. TaxID=2039241 RepID=UPI0028AEE931|nr:hypothetical protein [Anaerotignum sp.]
MILKKEIHTIAMTSANADVGHFQNPTPIASYFSFEKVQKRFKELINEEKKNLNSRYDTEEHGDTYWEMCENGYAAACFIRIDIVTSEIEDCPLLDVAMEV